MIRPITLVLACSLVSQAPAQSPSRPSAEQSYRQGLAAEKAGDPAAASAHYQNALKTDPKHANARFSLGQLKLTSASIAAKGREAKFGGVMIPSFQLSEATFKEAVEALAMMIEKESAEQVAPNFVIKDPDGRLTQQKITMSLKAVPSKAVLQLLMDQAGAKAHFDEYAIVITPR